MHRKLTREIALLALPILIIGAVAFWRTRDGAPEDVWSGKARLVTRVRSVNLTPLDIYRGYTDRIAIDQWAAGQLSPTPVPRVGALQSYRDVTPRYSPLYVAFRQGKTWKRTLSVAELVDGNADKSLKTPNVAPQIASLRMEIIDSAGEDRSKFTSNYILRLPTSPRVEEAFLMGRTRAEVQDRDTIMVGGVSHDSIVKQSELSSEPLKVKLEINQGVAGGQAGSPAQTPSQSPDWKVKTVTVFPPGQLGSSTLSIDISLDSTSQVGAASGFLLIKPHLLDAKGREVGKSTGASIGPALPNRGTTLVTAHFQLTSKQWKNLPKPLTFQSALSIGNGWPQELNLELEKPNMVLPPKLSSLRFIREPLPLR